jgi:hypothetical protein
MHNHIDTSHIAIILSSTCLRDNLVMLPLSKYLSTMQHRETCHDQRIVCLDLYFFSRCLRPWLHLPAGEHHRRRRQTGALYLRRQASRRPQGKQRKSKRAILWLSQTILGCLVALRFQGHLGDSHSHGDQQPPNERRAQRPQQLDAENQRSAEKRLWHLHVPNQHGTHDKSGRTKREGKRPRCQAMKNK